MYPFHVICLALYKVTQGFIKIIVMQLFTKSGRAAVVVALLVFAGVLASCGGSKKYGCPNHLFTPTLVK
jgi:hypothetical protein